MPPRNKHRLIIAAIVALIVIGASVWYTQFRAPEEIPFKNDEDDTKLLEAIRPLQATDHVRGNPAAKLVYIVYSDFGCPYCKEFHTTMQAIADKYGREGNVAWVFRQMPLVQLHPQANMYALSSECVAKLGGNQAFWKFADLLFQKKVPDTEVSASELVALAVGSGVDANGFTACMQSNDLQARITQDFDEARAAGAQGSPFTIIMTQNQRVSFEGKRPVESMVGATEAVLRTISITTLESPGTTDSVGAQFTKQLQEGPANIPAQNNQAVPATTTRRTMPGVLIP